MPDPKQIVYSPVDIDDAQYTDFEPDEKMAEENAEFDAFKSEMRDSQDDAKITVGKKLTDSRGRPMGRQTFECFECGIDDYTFSQLCTRIREDFGTGLYTVLGRNSKGAYKFRKTVGILAPNNVTDNVPAQNDVGGLIDKFSDAMQRQQMATEQMFLKIAGPQTGGDAIDQIVKIAGAVAPILATLGLSRNEQVAPKTLIEQLTEFKLLKELMGSDNESGVSGDDNLYSLLGKTVEAFGGPIAAAIAAGADSGQLNAEGVAALPAPLPENQTEIEKVKEMEKEKLAMRKNIHILIQNAKTGIPPESFALILINNTPPEKEDDLWKFISAENCVDTIIGIEPAAEMHREWFNDLRTHVIELMTEPDGESEGEENLQREETESTVPEVDSVAGVDEQSETATNDTNNGDTSEHT